MGSAQGLPLGGILRFAFPGTYLWSVPSGVNELYVEVTGGGAGGGGGQGGGIPGHGGPTLGRSGASGDESTVALVIGTGIYNVLAAALGGDPGTGGPSYGTPGTGGFAQTANAQPGLGQLALPGPAGIGGTAGSGTTGGNGGAGGAGPLGLQAGGIPGIGIAGGVASAGGQQSLYPGAGGGGGAGVGGTNPGAGGGGGGGAAYTAGYLPVRPGQVLQIVVGAGGGGGAGAIDYTNVCRGGSGAPGLVVLHLNPARSAEMGTALLDLQRHFGAAGSNATGTGAIAAGSNILTTDLLVLDGQGISVAGAGAGGGTLYATVLSGGGSESLTLSLVAQTSVSGATVTWDDTVAIGAFSTVLGGTGTGYVPPGTYNVRQAPTFSGGSVGLSNGALVSILGGAGVAFDTYLPSIGGGGGGGLSPSLGITFTAFELTSTAATAVATYTPSSDLAIVLRLAVTVVTAVTVLTLTATWTDPQAGAQSYTWENATSLGVGVRIELPILVCAAAANAVTITATAGTANQVYLTGSMERTV